MDRKIQNDPDMLGELIGLVVLIWAVATIAVCIVAACWTDFTLTTLVFSCALGVIITALASGTLAPLCILRLNPLECAIVVDELLKKQYFYSRAGAIFILPWAKEYKRISLHKQLVVTSGGDPLDGIPASEAYSTRESGNVYVQYGFVLEVDIHNLDEALQYLNIPDTSRAEIFRQEATQFLSDEIAKSDTLQALLARKNELSALLADTFDPLKPGGVNLEMCKQYRVKVKSVSLYKLSPSPEIVAALEAEIIALKQAAATKAQFGKEMSELTERERLMALYVQDPTGIQFLDVSGAPNLTALGGEIGTFVGSRQNNRRPNQKRKPKRE